MAIKTKIPSPSEVANQINQQSNDVVNPVDLTQPTSNKSTKFTPEELQSIDNLQKNLNQLTYQLGQLNISEMRLEKSKKQLLDDLDKIENEEKNLATTLNKKYGKGSLDTKTGEFTPTK